MVDALTFDPAHTALLVMDVQNDMVANHVSNGTPFLARLDHLVAAARRRGVRVIYVVCGFRPGYPEAGTRNAVFAGVPKTGRLQLGTTGCEVHSAVAPRDGEVTVIKHRVSAFSGTDLEVVLRANGIDTLLLTGISTSGVVLSTLRHAADLDYRCVVVSDGCIDKDTDVHRMLIDRVFPRQARVAEAAELLGSLGA